MTGASGDFTSGRTPGSEFRGRLGSDSDEAPVRHLRPVRGGREGTPRSDPGGGRTTGGAPVEEAEGVPPPQDEEEPHGPDPGGNR